MVRDLERCGSHGRNRAGGAEHPDLRSRADRDGQAGGPRRFRRSGTGGRTAVRLRTERSPGKDRGREAPVPGRCRRAGLRSDAGSAPGVRRVRSASVRTGPRGEESERAGHPEGRRDFGRGPGALRSGSGVVRVPPGRYRGRRATGTGGPGVPCRPAAMPGPAPDRSHGRQGADADRRMHVAGLRRRTGPAGTGRVGASRVRGPAPAISGRRAPEAGGDAARRPGGAVPRARPLPADRTQAWDPSA